MVFKRRDKRPILGQFRDALYPRRGWRRAIEYIFYRIKRLPDSPHKISLGFACGVFISFTPLFGFHFLAAVGLALLFRGNVLASLLGTFFGNPVTFPFIATISFRTGQLFLGGSSADVTFFTLKDAIYNGVAGFWHSLLSIFGLSEPAWADVLYFVNAVFLPYLLGSIIPGTIAGFFFYILARPLVAAYQKTRHSNLLRRAERKRKKMLSSAADAAE